MQKYLYVGVAVIVVLFFAAMFFHPWFMPGPWAMVIAAGLIVLAGVFLGLVWWEREGEAKDHMLVILPDRAGLLAGIGVIAVAILVESSLGEADPWLFVALGTAFVAREAAKWYRRGKAKSIPRKEK